MPILIVFVVLALVFGAIYWFGRKKPSTSTYVPPVENAKQDAKGDVQNKC